MVVLKLLFTQQPTKILPFRLRFFPISTIFNLGTNPFFPKLNIQQPPPDDAKINNILDPYHMHRRIRSPYDLSLEHKVVVKRRLVSRSTGNPEGGGECVKFLDG